MKVFVWRRIGQATNNYHSEGGVVVFAKSEKRAREIANAVDGCCIEDSEAPNDVRDVTDGKEAVYIMPDAGCC